MGVYISYRSIIYRHYTVIMFSINCCVCTFQRIIDAIKVDVESAEWSMLRDLTLGHHGDSLYNVKQLILEIHTPRFIWEHSGMSLSDYAQIYHSMVLLREKLGFKNYLYHDINNCCGNFALLTFANEKRLCCYETFHINSRFLK